MDKQRQHWEEVYEAKGPTELSWYRPHLEISMALIERVSPDRSAAIIDVGGGESTLVDDLALRGYQDISVLDISRKAIEETRQRLGHVADNMTWIVGDICKLELPESCYQVWHDRAVFHFLTLPEQRAAYRVSAAAAIKRNGHILISTFGPEGPTRCSGLDTTRYDATTLADEFRPQFRLTDDLLEWHTTPAGKQQQFLYGIFKRA